MATQVLAVDAGAGSSADIALDAGEDALVCLNDARGPKVSPAALVAIELKDADGAYWRIDTLTGRDPSRIVSGPATVRFSRIGPASCGVFRA